MTRIELMKDFLEKVAETTEQIITDNFGSEFSWEEHVGMEWLCGGDRPFTTSPEERYLLMTLWNMRHEANDVLHYLIDATETEIKELLDS